MGLARPKVAQEQEAAAVLEVLHESLGILPACFQHRRLLRLAIGAVSLESAGPVASGDARANQQLVDLALGFLSQSHRKLLAPRPAIHPIPNTP